MNLPLEQAHLRPADEIRRPRVMIAGEFSSGKSCLVNALLGERLLPSSVTSTSLPPLRFVAGEGAALCLGLDGQARSFATLPELLEHLLRVDPATIHHCRIPHPAPILQRFHLIDTPGHSDPNLPATSWERMVPHADLILWCSNAVQAWRQSEKAAWLAIPPAVAAQSLLVLSHADRMPDPADREKVLRRVRLEAGHLFAGIHMASFLSDRDVEALAGTLAQAVATLPARPGQPFEEPAPLRMAPRRLRPRPASVETDAEAGPLLLVPDEALPEAPPEEAAEEMPQPVPEPQAVVAEAPSPEPEPEPEAAPPAVPPFGPARMLWARILPTLDPLDPESLLEGVEQLVQDLDLAWAQAAAAAPRRPRTGG